MKLEHYWKDELFRITDSQGENVVLSYDETRALYTLLMQIFNVPMTSLPDSDDVPTHPAGEGAQGESEA